MPVRSVTEVGKKSDPRMRCQKSSTNLTFVNSPYWRLDVGILNGQQIDLVITDATSQNTYPNIRDRWGDREDEIVERAEKSDFGIINLQVDKNDENAGYGKFEFCFMGRGNFNKQNVPEFIFTFYDIDTSNLKEELIINRNQYESMEINRNQ